MKKMMCFTFLIILFNLAISVGASESSIIPIPKVTSLLFIDNETILAGTNDQRLIRYYLVKPTIEKEIKTDCCNYLRLNKTKEKCVGMKDQMSSVCTVFCARSLKELCRLDLYRTPYWNFQSCNFSNMDENILFLSWIKAIERYNITTQKVETIDHNSYSYNNGIAIHSTKDILYVATQREEDNGGLAIYDCDTSPVQIKYIPFINHSYPFSCISNNDSSYVALCDAYNRVNIVDANNSVAQVPNMGVTKSFAFHPIKKNILAILRDDEIRLIYWDIEKRYVVGEQNFSDKKFNLDQWLENIAFSPDGKRIIIGLNESCILQNMTE